MRFGCCQYAGVQPIFDQLAIAVRDELAAIDSISKASNFRKPANYGNAEVALNAARQKISEWAVELERFRLSDL